MLSLQAICVCVYIYIYIYIYIYTKYKTLVVHIWISEVHFSDIYVKNIYPFITCKNGLSTKEMVIGNSWCKIFSVIWEQLRIILLLTECKYISSCIVTQLRLNRYLS